MKYFIAPAALPISATLVSADPNVRAPRGDHSRDCTARVLYSEELPFAPEGKWLVNVALEITPPSGDASITLHDWMLWQGPPPRRGQVFRLLCDRAHRDNLHLALRLRV